MNDITPAAPAGLQTTAKAIAWLVDHYTDQPSLADTAAAVGLSPHHFQRMFTRNVGVSPKKYVQYLTLNHLKDCLAASSSVLDAAYDAGLSGPGRMHDLFVTHEAMTPGEWKAGAAGLDIRYGWHDSPFGDCLIAATPRGVCGLAFRDTSRDAALANLSRGFAEATPRHDPAATKRHADAIFAGTAEGIHLVLRATPFQLQVWQALLQIPTGALVSYQGLATRLGQPTASRAVAGAVARNQISWLIPCHRVVKADGSISGYRWHPRVKRAMLAWEGAKELVTDQPALAL